MDTGFASQDQVPAPFTIPSAMQIEGNTPTTTAVRGVKVECNLDEETKAKLSELASSYGNVKKVLVAADKLWNKLDEKAIKGSLARAVYEDMTHLQRTSATEWCESGYAI